MIKFCQGTGLRRHELARLKGSDLLTKEQIQAQMMYLENKSGLSADEKTQLRILQDTKYFNAEYYTRTVGKGGRERISPIVGKNVEQIVERIKETPADAKVWQHINSNADIHSYRSDYAVTIYKEHAREISEIPYDRVNRGTGRPYQSGVYVCRKDESGRKLDKEAMLVCSKALGHNRIEIVANNYIRGL